MYFSGQNTNRLFSSLFVLLVGVAIPLAATAQGSSPTYGGCPMFPSDHVFNTPINNLPVSPNSAAYVAEMGAGPAHPDWGSATPGAYPVNLVHGNSVPPAVVNIAWPFTSDTPPFPIPSNAVVGAPTDDHLIVLDIDNCLLYEAYAASENADGSWNVEAISRFNLNSDALKPANWSSSNAAGTAQLPLLVRYDEVAAGQINHAISVTGVTGNAYIWPASHSASSLTAAPPMGTRFRLQASYDISGLTPQAMVVAQALKTYGAILTDNGPSWHLQGVPDPRFSDDDLHSLTTIPASAFEAVDESSLEISATSGQVASPGTGGGGDSISINPSSGKGVTQTFTVSYTGASQAQEHIFFNSTLTGNGSCYFIYDRNQNSLMIGNDQGSAVLAWTTPGSGVTLANDQCSAPASTATTSTSGNTVTLTITITFTPSFVGAKNVYANILDASYVPGTWQQIGTWTVPSATTGNTIAINPSSGAGVTQTFTIAYTSTSQAQEHLFFNSAPTGKGSCYFIYDRSQNSLMIGNDQGNAVLAATNPGSSLILANDQCSAPASSASVSTSGNTVTLTLTITFTPSFAGAQNVYANILDASYVPGTWQTIGTWSVP